jgi:hypothetical protein
MRRKNKVFFHTRKEKTFLAVFPDFRDLQRACPRPGTAVRAGTSFSLPPNSQISFNPKIILKFSCGIRPNYVFLLSALPVFFCKTTT